uniref:Reelin domain-containing protein n=2 Tax=Glossina TaxID=44049 RepID=A0A1B0AGQ8_GLOPL
MPSVSSKAISVLIILSVMGKVIESFPNGAPSDTCVKKRPNQPNHGQARPQPLHTNPFEVVASSESYHPGQEISVVVYPHTKQELFRGFFIQARDADTNEWIGEWVKSENTNTIPECAAITHGDNKDKLAAKLIWKAPQNKRGRVYFTYREDNMKENSLWAQEEFMTPFRSGTVLQSYGTFWSDIIGKVQQHS